MSYKSTQCRTGTSRFSKTRASLDGESDHGGEKGEEIWGLMQPLGGVTLRGAIEEGEREREGGKRDIKWSINDGSCCGAS